MWQSQGSSPPGAKNGSKKAHKRYHLRRVDMEVRFLGAEGVAIQQDPMRARLVLNDLSPYGVNFFTQTAFHADQEVEITLHEPAMITIKGRVVSCSEQGSTSKVISHARFGYRVGIEFTFDSPRTEQVTRSFCESLLRTLNPVAAAA